jgi:hypothetical protein
MTDSPRPGHRTARKWAHSLAERGRAYGVWLQYLFGLWAHCNRMR